MFYIIGEWNPGERQGHTQTSELKCDGSHGLDPTGLQTL